MKVKRRGALFYRLVLPAFTVVNLGLGVFMLVGLHPAGWIAWMELVTGSFCCAVAGCLLGAGLSKTYWSSAMERQISAWRRMADAMFRWIEETPVPVDSLKTLKRSLDETIRAAPGSPAQRASTHSHSAEVATSVEWNEPDGGLDQRPGGAALGADNNRR